LNIKIKAVSLIQWIGVFSNYIC